MKQPPKPPLDPAWAKELETVRPLGAKAPPQPPTPKLPAPTNPDIYALPTPKKLVGWHDNPPIPITSNTPERISGHADGMDPHIVKNLARGTIRPTTVLDLHGLGEGDAWLYLTDFLHKCVVDDHRCVLVIHGKGTGYGPGYNMGVIKFQIATWLASHPKVLAFHTALQTDGGSGALYAYLKRYGK